MENVEHFYDQDELVEVHFFEIFMGDRVISVLFKDANLLKLKSL